MAIPSKISVFNYPKTANIYDEIVISWEEVEEATGYVLERKHDNGNYVEIYSGNNLSFTDTVFLGWDSCQYRIKATNNDGDSEYTESDIVEIVYIEIDSKGILKPFNMIVDFKQSKLQTIPNVAETTEKLAEVDGEISLSRKYEPRLFDIVANTRTITLIERNELEEKMGDVLHCIKQKERLLRYKNKLYRITCTMSPDNTLYATGITTNISFKANNPYGYSEQKTFVGNGTITVNGNIETYPVFKISDCSGTTTIIVNGKSFYIGQSLLVTDIVVVDCETETVKLNGTTNIRGIWLEDDFPIFNVGENTVSIAQGNITTYWKDKYIRL